MKEYIKQNKEKIINTTLSLTIIILEVILIIILLIKKDIVKAQVVEEPIIENKEEISNKIKIEIKGAVVTPGVYEIEQNSRVADAITIAGGLLENANTSILNLAKKLADEMVIIIYSNEDIENYKNDHQKIEYIYLEKECNCPDTVNQACINNEDVYATEESLSKQEANKNPAKEEPSLININTASIEQLTTLTGIGESKAKKIIDYRTANGNFKTIEDLQNVDGIGTSTIEKIKAQITI